MKEYIDAETGYKVFQYTYEDWEKGQSPEPYKVGKHRVPINDISNIAIQEFPESEFNAIRKRQREIFDDWVNERIEKEKKTFHDYL